MLLKNFMIYCTEHLTDATETGTPLSKITSSAPKRAPTRIMPAASVKAWQVTALLPSASTMNPSVKLPEKGSADWSIRISL